MKLAILTTIGLLAQIAAGQDATARAAKRAADEAAEAAYLQMFHRWEDFAVSKYPEAGREGSPMWRRMTELQAEMLRAGDPAGSDVRSAYLIALIAAEELGIPAAGETQVAILAANIQRLREPVELDGRKLGGFVRAYGGHWIPKTPEQIAVYRIVKPAPVAKAPAPIAPVPDATAEIQALRQDMAAEAEATRRLLRQQAEQARIQRIIDEGDRRWRQMERDALRPPGGVR